MNFDTAPYLTQPKNLTYTKHLINNSQNNSALTFSSLKRKYRFMLLLTPL